MIKQITAQTPTAKPSVKSGIMLRKHTFSQGFTNSPDFANRNNHLHRKLAIGSSHDPLERQADRVADQVLTGRAPQIQPFMGSVTEAAETTPTSVDRVLASPGRSLEPNLQQDLGQRFGHDFSQVRVHTGAGAEQSARDVNAQAYTVRNNIVFGAGQYAPQTNQGRRLLAHELTHVVQQSSNPGKAFAQPLGISPPSEPAQMEAENITHRTQNGFSAFTPIHQSAIGLQRQPDKKGSDSVTLSSGLSINAKLFAEMMTMCAEGKLDPVSCIEMKQAAGLLPDPLAKPSPSFGFKPFDLKNRSSSTLPSLEETERVLAESKQALGKLGIGKPILLPNVSPGIGPRKPNSATPLPTIPTPSTSSLDELLSFKFKAGPFQAEVELPKSLKLKLPVALTKAKTLTFEIQAESSKTFSASIKLNGLPHVSIALKAQMKLDQDKGNTGSAGLEIQTTRTVCQADNPENLKTQITAKGIELTKAMKELETALPDERLGKLTDIAGAIGAMYDAIDKSKKACKQIPFATFNFGLQGPLNNPSPDKIEPDPLMRPAPYLGGSLTIPF